MHPWIRLILEEWRPMLNHCTWAAKGHKTKRMMACKRLSGLKRSKHVTVKPGRVWYITIYHLSNSTRFQSHQNLCTRVCWLSFNTIVIIIIIIRYKIPLKSLNANVGPSLFHWYTYRSDITTPLRSDMAAKRRVYILCARYSGSHQVIIHQFYLDSDTTKMPQSISACINSFISRPATGIECGYELQIVSSALPLSEVWQGNLVCSSIQL